MESATRKRRGNRSRAEIVFGILDLLSAEDRQKTDIVYGSNLSFSSIRPYLERLVEQGYVAWNERTRLWHLTPAGEDARKVLKDSLKAIEAIL